MALNEITQIQEAIRKSRHILITFNKEYSIDSIASALALCLILEKQNKLIDIVCDGFSAPKNLQFLPGIEKINPTLSSLQKLVITIPGGKEKIEQFNYDVDNNDLKIFIIPKSGSLTNEQIEIQNSDYKYDLIFVFDTPDLDSLGQVYLSASEFFYNTTIINIDHKPENEQFGQINLTDPNAVATAEILYDLIIKLDKNMVDQKVATCLLTGLVAKTRSFKTANVRPKTLEIASQLLAAEADQQTIIKSLYRSRNISTLNLWGRVLARLKSDKGGRLAWSLLTDHDFIDSGAGEKDLPDVIEELISYMPPVEVVVLFYQLGGQIKIIANALKNYNALYLVKSFKPTGTKNWAQFIVGDKNLVEVEKEVIEQIKNHIG